MTDLDALPFDDPDWPPPDSSSTAEPRKCRRHRWMLDHTQDAESRVLSVQEVCRYCRVVKDVARSRRGKQSRNYGNRAELSAARTYGGVKVGHAGGPVDIRGRDWNTQVKTHRRLPPAEWTKVFAAMAASTERLPRLLLRFVQTGGGREPVDYFVIPAKAFLDWYGRDDPEEAA